MNVDFQDISVETISNIETIKRNNLDPNAKYVLYLNIGKIPNHKAEQYCIKYSKLLREFLELDKGSILVIPFTADEKNTTRLVKII